MILRRSGTAAVRSTAAAFASAAVSLLLAFGAAACGDDAADGTPRVIEFEMVEHSYAPAAITVEQGEFVILRFHNVGKVRHEAVVGDMQFQEEHRGHEHAGNVAMVNAVLVDAGQTGDVPYRFDVPGQIVIGCHEPDHWEQGMRTVVTVMPSKTGGGPVVSA